MELEPDNRDSWRSYYEIADLFTTLSDPSWATDLRRIRDDVEDPWEDR